MIKHGSVVLALVLAVTLGASAAFAGPDLKANIPFDFVVGGATLAAGNYYFKATSTPQVFLLRSEDGKHSAMVLGRVDSMDALGNPRLVFNRYDSLYCLSRVWTGEGNGLAIPPSKFEREVAREARVAAPTTSIAAVLVR